MINRILKKALYISISSLSFIPFLTNANVDDIDFKNDAGLPSFNSGSGFIKYETPYYFVIVIIKELIKYVGIFAIIAMMIGGIMYISSLGVEDKIKKAKNIVIYSIVGVLVSILSYALVDIVNNLTLN
ncbi:MAG: hypothetical protein PHS92_03040 [Candidatus Gracilibacteria bacterium]|nr:hypothetical protein [Candidatus Gracilibacteria bacterium]